MPAHRIAYVDLAPAVGGSVISLYHLVKGLDRARFEPYVILSSTNDYASRFRDLGISVMTLAQDSGSASCDADVPQARRDASSKLRGSSLAARLRRSAIGQRLVHLVGFYWRTWPELRRTAQELSEYIATCRPDLVHLNDVVCVSRAGIMAAKGLGVPAICHLRAMAWRTHYDRWLSKSLSGYICISQAVERHQRSLGGRTSPSWVVHNGLDLQEFSALPDTTSLRRELADLDLAPDDQVVGSVGRLVEWKGHHIFLRALARVAPHHPRLRALVVGSPEAHSADYARHLRTLAHELGLTDIVTFTGFRHDIPRVLGAMDIMVHASVSPEPFGRVLIEAMAAGAMVIGTRAGAVPEIVDEGVTGMLVSPGDVSAMAAAMAYSLDHPDQRAAWQDAAKTCVVERFGADRYVQGVERVYEELLR